MTVKIEVTDLRRVQEILGRCLDEYQYQPDIGFGESDLASEIRAALDILSDYDYSADEQELEELDFN